MLLLANISFTFLPCVLLRPGRGSWLVQKEFVFFDFQAIKDNFQPFSLIFISAPSPTNLSARLSRAWHESTKHIKLIPDIEQLHVSLLLVFFCISRKSLSSGLMFVIEKIIGYSPRQFPTSAREKDGVRGRKQFFIHVSEAC